MKLAWLTCDAAYAWVNKQQLAADTALRLTKNRNCMSPLLARFICRQLCRTRLLTPLLCRVAIYTQFVHFKDGKPGHGEVYMIVDFKHGLFLSTPRKY